MNFLLSRNGGRLDSYVDRSREPLLDLCAAWNATGMNNLTIYDDARCRHHTVTHDVAELLDFCQADRNALFFSDLLDKGGRIFAVGASGSENFDVFHGEVPFIS